MAEYNFKKDIVQGEQGEMEIMNFLENKGLKFITFNKDKKYDIIMLKENKEITYEIKTDVYCKPERDTGNIYAETESWNRKSGIMVCEADWFVYYYKHLNEAWFIKLDKLINLIETHKNNFNIIKEKINGGDKGSNTKGYTIKREAVREEFHVYKIN